MVALLLEDTTTTETTPLFVVVWPACGADDAADEILTSSNMSAPCGGAYQTRAKVELPGWVYTIVFNSSPPRSRSPSH